MSFLRPVDPRRAAHPNTTAVPTDATDATDETGATGSRPRAWRRASAILLLVTAAASAAHVWFWYAPRGRATRPDPIDLPHRLLVDGKEPVRLWLAYPHQNLGALARSDPAIAGIWDAALPPFAVFRAPPARELAISWGPEGGIAAARVYPSVAVLAKAAGALAGNPWLSGGAVAVGGAPGAVEWRGRLWIARWGRAQLPGGDPDGTPPPRAAGAQVLRVELEPAGSDPGAEGGGSSALFPASAGSWTGRFGAGGVTLVRLDGGPGLLPEAPQAAAVDRIGADVPPELALLAVREWGASAEALVVVDQPQEPGVLRLPSAALASAGPAFERRALRLPAEELFEALGARTRRETIGAWSLVATDRRSAELCAAILPRVEHPAQTAVVSESWLVVFRPRALHRLARGVDQALETIPVGGRELRERWRRHREWTRALAGAEWIGVAIAPDRIDLRSAGPERSSGAGPEQGSGAGPEQGSRVGAAFD